MTAEVRKPRLPPRWLRTVAQRHEDLVALKDLIEAGKVTPVMDRAYLPSETAQAIDHVGAGHARGKVAITVQEEVQALVRVA